MAEWEPLIARAIERRKPLLTDRGTTCWRCVNGRGDGLDGVTLDAFGEVGVLSFYREPSPTDDGLLEAVRSTTPLRTLYVKRRPKEARVVANTQRAALAPETPAWGEPSEAITEREHGLRFVIKPGQGFAVGLYLDMRDTRAWVREHVRGQTVLNLFAYTCAFGVYALDGGASRVANVDLSRRSLSWGEDNARANSQPIDPRDFIAEDAFQRLARRAKRNETFDWAILDPPSFAKGKRGVFSAETDYSALVRATAPAIRAGGTLLTCCNLASQSEGWLERSVRTGLTEANRAAEPIARLGASPIDFPSAKDQPAALKVLAWRLRD